MFCLHFRSIQYTMHRKYRIALVSDYYYPNKGGIESHIHNLALSLISLGHYVIIITHKYPGHLGIIDNGIKVYYLNIPIVAANTSFPNMYSNISLISIFLNEKIDVVHGHQSMSNLTLEAIFHAKTIGLKTVLTEHSLFDLGGFENIIVDRLCMLILRSCDLFITVSMTAKVNFVERLSVEWNKVHVIQNAIDSNIFYAEKNDENLQENIRNRDVYSQKASKENVRDDNRKKGTIDDPKSNNYEAKTNCKNYIKLDDSMKNHRKIIIVSRLVKRKGIDILLDIIPMLFKRLESISVIIVGDGPYRDNLEQMIDYNNLRDVHFYGELDHESLANLLRQCDVFLNTSLTEAFCMAILEAAACGCKVVSTNVGGIHEVLPETVLTLTNIDPEEIVDAICNVLCKEKCDISEIIDNVYRWELVALKTVDVYDSIKSGSIDFKTRIEHYHWFWEVICRMYIVFEYIFVSIYLKLYH